MVKEQLDWSTICFLLESLEKGQYEKVLTCGQRLLPNLTTDDILQPNDFPLLEDNSHFRYEEGVLEGIRTVYMALRALHD